MPDSSDRLDKMPSHARAVVIGGGVLGVSVLYHLAALKVTDCVLVELNELTSGSTWHAAGLCTQYAPDINLMTVLRSGIELYRQLDAEADGGIGFHGCGSLRIATTPGQVDELRRVQGIADTVGVPFEIVDPDGAVELFPLASSEGILGAAYLSTDGWVDPAQLTGEMSSRAREAGATVLRHVGVTGLVAEAGGGWTVTTTRGRIRADIVVNAAGQWASEVGRLAGVDLPICSLLHQYLLTEPLAELDPLGRELPVLRDLSGSFYVRQDQDALLVGAFEPRPPAFGVDGIPRDFHNSLVQPDLAQIEDVLHAASRRIPRFADAGIKRIINGPDGCTPDGRGLLGPVAGARNFYVAAGFNFFGIVFGGGAGRQLAEWIVNGEPSENLWSLDARRFGQYATASSTYVLERASQSYEREYAVRYPFEELPAGRPLKTSPLYHRLAGQGAVYGERFGWERPLYFEEPQPSSPPSRRSLRRERWQECVGRECHSVRSGVGVLDQTSFAKFELSGPKARETLDQLCANRLPGDGKITLSQMCTQGGGIACDVTVTCLGDDRFYLISAAAAEEHDFGWIEDHLPSHGTNLSDVTAEWSVLTLAGPKARLLLAALTRADCSPEAFPPLSLRQIEVGRAPVRALRVSYTGELGFELHHRVEYQSYLYEAIRSAGAEHGCVDFGYYALESLRLEMGYRAWGSDISAVRSPLEAGLERFVRFDKGPFIGRDALLRQHDVGVAFGLAALRVDAADADCSGHEPVYAAGERIGWVECGGFAHTLGVSLAYAYLPRKYLEPGTPVEVSILGERRAGVVIPQPPLRAITPTNSDASVLATSS